MIGTQIVLPSSFTAGGDLPRVIPGSPVADIAQRWIPGAAEGLTVGATVSALPAALGGVAMTNPLSPTIASPTLVEASPWGLPVLKFASQYLRGGALDASAAGPGVTALFTVALGSLPTSARHAFGFSANSGTAGVPIYVDTSKLYTFENSATYTLHSNDLLPHVFGLYVKGATAKLYADGLFVREITRTAGDYGATVYPYVGAANSTYPADMLAADVAVIKRELTADEHADMARYLADMYRVTLG